MTGEYSDKPAHICCLASLHCSHSQCIEQGSHRLEKYLNLEGFLEKSLKIKYVRKVLENPSKALKSPRILLLSVGLSTVDRELNQYTIVVPLFGAACAAPNIGTTISY